MPETVNMSEIADLLCAKPVEKIPTPWSERAKELEPVEAHWSDYAAWEEWFSRQQCGPHDSGSDILSELDWNQKALLYGAFVDAAVFGQTPTVEVVR